MNRRIVLSRRAGWTMPENAISVARPTALGNPYQVFQHCKGPRGDWGVRDLGRLHIELSHGWSRRGAQQLAVDSYAHLFNEIYPPATTARLSLATYLAEHDLGCWCRIEFPCHVDFLLTVGAEHGQA